MSPDGEFGREVARRLSDELGRLSGPHPHWAESPVAASVARRRIGRPAWVLLGAGAVLASSLLGGLLLSSGTNRVSPIASSIEAVAPTGSQASSASATAWPLVPTQPPAQVTSTWTSVSPPSVPGPTNAIGGLAGGFAYASPEGGFIAFVPVAADRSGVLISPDGSHWSQSGTVSRTDALGISGPVAYNGQVYVALGSEGGGLGSYASPSNGAAWVSPDLRHWTKAPAQDAFASTTFNAIAAGRGSFVAVGYQKSGRTMWTSSDGLHWTTVEDDRLFPVEATEIRAIVYTSGGFVAVGRIRQAAATWTSPDGVSWSLHSPIGDGSAIELVGLANGSSGVLSFGMGPTVQVAPNDYRSPMAGWTSSDGTTWQAGPESPALFGAYPYLVSTPGGFAAAAMVGAGPTADLWTSRDGLDWVPVAGLNFAGVELTGLVSDGRHVLLSGVGPAGSSLWVSDGIKP